MRKSPGLVTERDWTVFPLHQECQELGAAVCFTIWREPKEQSILETSAHLVKDESIDERLRRLLKCGPQSEIHTLHSSCNIEQCLRITLSDQKQCASGA